MHIQRFGLFCAIYALLGLSSPGPALAVKASPPIIVNGAAAQPAAPRPGPPSEVKSTERPQRPPAVAPTPLPLCAPDPQCAIPTTEGRPSTISTCPGGAPQMSWQP